MSNMRLRSFIAVLFMAALAACGSSPYAPVVTKADPIDPDAYARKVDNFIVLLDTSGSMNTDDQGRPRMYAAQDWTASFNSAVPPMDFKAGLVTFGKGDTGSCIGYGIASNLVDFSTYNATAFGNALGSLKCAASTTPIADAIDAKLVVVVSRTGGTAWVKSKQRNFIPTLGVSNSASTLRRMGIFWGIMPMAVQNLDNPQELFEEVSRWGKDRGLLKTGDRVVFVTGTGVIDNTHNLLVVHSIT